MDAYSKQDKCVRTETEIQEQWQIQLDNDDKKSLFQKIKEIITGTNDENKQGNNIDISVGNNGTTFSRDAFVQRLQVVDSNKVIQNKQESQIKRKEIDENSR